MTTPPVRYEVSGVAFSFYSSEDTRRLSVKRITQANSFDALGLPVPCGLYDPALGPTDKFGTCKTCGLIYKQCPGHFGHIELVEPLYNPLLLRYLLQLMCSACWYCDRLRMPDDEMTCAISALKAMRDGKMLSAVESSEIYELLHVKETSVGGGATGGGAEDAATEATGMWDRVSRIIYKGNEEHDQHVIEGQKKGIVGVLDEENQTIHMQELRKHLVKAMIKSMTAASKKCPHCEGLKVKTRFDDTRTKMLLDNYNPSNPKAKKARASSAAAAASTAISDAAGKTSTFVTPSRAREHLRSVWNINPLQHELLCLIYGSRTVYGLPAASPDLFFMEVLPVPPNRFRPVVELGGIRSEHPHSGLYKKILEINEELVKYNQRPLGPDGKPIDPEDAKDDGEQQDLEKVQKEAEAALNNKKKNTSNANKQKKRATPTRGRSEMLMEMQSQLHDLCASADADKAPSIKAMMEKKQGLLRKHMMGKRVNFAARSVISPDPFINTNEIGLPHFFCMRLSYPEPVTPRNVEKLKQQVINGPEVYPGANAIEDEFGNVIELKRGNKAFRQSEAARLLTVAANAPRKYKTVLRHLKDGDMALVNRQPTLHKPGIMAQSVRVLGRERTLRLHYSNCSTFNADFDGDEMNIHVPQGELARAEAALIAFADEQYFVPKDGNPLRGLIQDSVITGVLLTKRDTFFTRDKFQQLLYACLYNVNEKHSILTPIPAILKPKPMWTGKQLGAAVLSHITVTLPPINLEANTKVSGSIWGRGGYTGPSVCTKKSEDMTDIWSGANDSLLIVSKNEILCGVLDKSQFGASAFGLVHSCFELYGSRIAGMVLSVMARLFVTYLQSYRGFTCAMDDLIVKQSVERSRRLQLIAANEKGKEAGRAYASGGKDNKEALEAGLTECRRYADKGSALDNAVKAVVNKISSKVIDQCLPDGQIKPFPLNGMSLMTASGARGSNVNFSQIACLLGQQELEGRRVPVMISGRSLPSFKPFETSAVAGGFVMDRFLTGVKPQEFFFHQMAGREGLIDTAVKTSRSGYLQRSVIKSLEGLSVNYDYSVRDGDGSVIQFTYGEDGLDVTRTCYLNKFKFWAQNFDALVTRYNTVEAARMFPKDDIPSTKKMLDDGLKDPAHNAPVMSMFLPGEKLGVLSEKFYSSLKDYIATDPDKLIKDKKVPSGAKFHGLMCIKYARCLVDPGESVGVLAGQSIGEPSTQMTLNTFHLAGRGDVNVTLGMPRLRELLMFAKQDISTPTMSLSTKSKTKEDAEKVAKSLSRLTLIDIVEDVKVTETLVREGHAISRNYQIDIKLNAGYEKKLADYHITTKVFAADKMKDFSKQLRLLISKRLKVKPATIGVERAKSIAAELGAPEGAAGGEEEDGEARELPEQEDAYTEEQSKKKAEATYDEPDEEDKEVIKGVDMEDAEQFEDAPVVQKTEDEEDEDEKSDEEATYSISNGVLSCTTKLSANQKVMMVSLAETACENTVLAECPGIKRSNVSSKPMPGGKGKEFFVQTEGVNFHYLSNLEDSADLNSVYSNDVYALLKFYGVEAARRAIVNEVGGVFKVYGINVDPRHLGLVADYMTFGGAYRPCNRMGIDSSTSTFNKMSFETTGEFLTRAALYREVDMMHSPAACIVVGRPVIQGTGCFEVRQVLNPDTTVHEKQPMDVEQELPTASPAKDSKLIIKQQF